MKDDHLIISPCCKARFEPIRLAISQLIKNSDAFPLLVAIDGKCASGKTTLGYYLKELFECNLFHMDDFFLQNHQRTPERFEEIGGNVDYERFKEEVLNPLLAQQEVLYRPFSCKERKIVSSHTVPYKRLNIIEGSYSMHPYFGKPYDLKIFMDINEEKQLERIQSRNGEAMLSRFRDQWIPMENAYFEKFQIKKDCLIIE